MGIQRRLYGSIAVQKGIDGAWHGRIGETILCFKTWKRGHFRWYSHKQWEDGWIARGRSLGKCIEETAKQLQASANAEFDTAKLALPTANA